MNNSPIGIFDSGIGGLTIVQAIKKLLPNENIIYFGDTKHLPYGEKSKEAIQGFSKEIIRFLVEKECKTIVIACNSASSVADDSVTKSAGNIPVYNVIDPVVKYVANECQNEKIGVIGTKATIHSNVYTDKIKAYNYQGKVVALATPLLAPMIEEGFIGGKISHTVIANYLSSPELKNIQHLILACTHYPLIRQEIEAYYEGKVDVIDSANIIATHIAKNLQMSNLIRKNTSPKLHFFVSNYTESFEKSAKFFFGEELKLEEISI